MRIAIAGASGFIGKNLIREIIERTDHDIVAISRTGYDYSNLRIESKAVDLYSLESLSHGLHGCSVGIYLIHSMSPSTRLSQGNFADFDFFLADNFARACQQNRIEHLVYLGGIIPENAALSEHLKSRLEVETILSSRNIPLTSIRSGLIVGPNGSSFRIITELAQKLPFMLLPAWMQTQSQPVFIGDVIDMIIAAIDDPQEKSRVVDVGGPEVFTYRQILETVANYLGKKPYLINVPYVSPHLSKLWVKLITGSPMALISPLIESIKHPMLVSEKHLPPNRWEVNLTPLDAAIVKTFKETAPKSTPHMTTQVRSQSEVRSVQRLPLPKYCDAPMIADIYTAWLPKQFLGILKVERDGDEHRFKLLGLPFDLLVLSSGDMPQSTDRFQFAIESGCLVGKDNRGTFEFRLSPDRKHVFAAIHHFKPALPWWVYTFSQALVHGWVMRRFGKHLSSLSQKNEQ